MFLVAALGNPGSKYRGHRHNVGFMVADALVESLGGGPFKEKFQGEVAKASIAGQEVVFLKPMTYMNLSGESVQKAMSFFKVDLKDVVVVHDELDIDFGATRVKVGGGAAGHNGLRSIIQHCGGPDFVRVRVGIGRPRSGSVEGFVLSDFDSSERAELGDVLKTASAAVKAVVERGAASAMNEFNVREKAARA